MIIAADNLTGANPVVAQALRDLDPAPLQDLARRSAAAGAHVLDLNPGYLSRRLEDRMAFMVTAVQEVTTLPLILDSPNPRVLAGGLAVSRDKPILNAVTLEKHKLDEILPLAAAHGTRVVLLLIDEKSHPPPTLEGKVALAVELRERALAAGLTDEQLIFDPVLPNLQVAGCLAPDRGGLQNRGLPGLGFAPGRPGEHHGGAFQPAQRPAASLPRRVGDYRPGAFGRRWSQPGPG